MSAMIYFKKKMVENISRWAALISGPFQVEYSIDAKQQRCTQSINFNLDSYIYSRQKWIFYKKAVKYGRIKLIIDRPINESLTNK